jgi:hypothetical protein
MVSSPAALGLNTTGCGGSSTGGWPAHRKVLLILIQEIIRDPSSLTSS